MKTQNKNTDNQFHAVDFMRQVRRELSKKYLQDKDQYLQDLKTAMENFKRKQEKAYSQHGYLQ